MWTQSITTIAEAAIECFMRCYGKPVSGDRKYQDLMESRGVETVSEL